MAPNLMSGPIPGQSLTAEPGSRPWEQPSQFNNVDDAMEFMIPRLLSPNVALGMSDLMEKGMPATAIADSILTNGFMEGKWSPDLMVLIGLPVYELVKKSVELAGGKVVTGLEDKYTYKPDDILMKLARDDVEKSEPKANALATPVEEESPEMPMENEPMGIMSKMPLGE